jgi:hypothetical protein
MLKVVVQPSVKNGTRVGELEEHEDRRAEDREGHGAAEDHERVAEAVELRGEDEEDEDHREAHRRPELGVAALLAELPGLAGVVDPVALRQDLRPLVLDTP